MALTLGLFVAGMILLALAWRLDGISALGNGTFALESVLAVVGCVCLGVALLMGGIRLVMLSTAGMLMVAAFLAAALGLVMVNAPGGGPPVANAGMALLAIGLAAFVLLGLGVAGGVL